MIAVKNLIVKSISKTRPCHINNALADGSRGPQLANSTTTASGKYTLNLSSQSGPVEIVASGGSYIEEATGTTVNMGFAQIRTLLPNTSATQQVAVTPVTEIAAQQAISSISSNPSTGVAAIVKSANAKVTLAMCLLQFLLLHLQLLTVKWH